MMKRENNISLMRNNIDKQRRKTPNIILPLISEKINFKNNEIVTFIAFQANHQYVKKR